MISLEKILETYPDATDIHLTENEPVSVRLCGNLKVLTDRADSDFFEKLRTEVLTGAARKQLEERGSADGAFTAENLRIRLHLYRSLGKTAASLRLLPALSRVRKDPDEPWLEQIAEETSGLVLFTGPSGSGKSTAMARVLTLISRKRPCHIITLEEPVEYLLPSGKALIHQREIGTDAPSFAEGVRDALREDPDVLCIGELRDSETMAAALTAAETGHLVLGTLHTPRAKDAVARIIHAFPSDKQGEARLLLASVLKACASQRLIRTGKNTVLLREILTNIPPVAHLIREAKEEQIPSYMEMGLHSMRTLKGAVYALPNISDRERERLLKSLD